MLLNELQKLREEYNFEITGKKAIVNVKKDELKKLQETLQIYRTEYEQLVARDQLLREQIKSIEGNISRCEDVIFTEENMRNSCCNEYNKIFVLSFARKIEIKKQIESIEAAILKNRQKLKELFIKKKKIESERKSTLLGGVEEKIKQSEILISSVNDDIYNLENSVLELENKIQKIDSQINYEKLKNEEVLNEKKANIEGSVREASGLDDIQCDAKIMDSNTGFCVKKSTLANDVYNAILSLTREDVCWNFFGELIGQGEYQKMEQRLFIAVLLCRGYKYFDITDMCGASTATISRVSQTIQWNDEFRRIITTRSFDKKINLKHLFGEIVVELDNLYTCKCFFGNLCSPIELQSMEQRYQIAELLYLGKTYNEITELLGVSSATIGKVRSVIDNPHSIVYFIISQGGEINNGEVENEQEQVGVEKEYVYNKNDVEKEIVDKNKLEHLYYKMPNIDAVGYEEKDGCFVVKKGSRVCTIERITCSAVTRNLRREYDERIDVDGVLKEDIIFKSANEATNFCCYGNSTSTLVWRTEDGVTLAESRNRNARSEEDFFGSDYELEVKLHLSDENDAIDERSTVEEVRCTEEQNLEESQALEWEKNSDKVRNFSSPEQACKIIEMESELFPYKNNILYGDFSFIDSKEFNDNSMVVIQKFRDAHEILDFELVEELVDGTPAVLMLQEALNSFVRSYDNKKKCEEIISNIPTTRLDMDVQWLINCYTSDENLKDGLQKLIKGENQKLRDYLFSNSEIIIKNDCGIREFYQWCQFDLKNDLDSFFVVPTKGERELFVISERAKGKTLEAVGNQINVSRERVRQIESKFLRKFKRWQSQSRILYKIFIEMDEKVSLSSMEIIDFIGENTYELVYLLKMCNPNEAIYDKELDSFIIDEHSVVDRIQTYIESLPEAFNKNKLVDFIKIGEQEYKCSEKLLMAVIEKHYKKTGDTYHRFRFTLESVYEDVLKRFYSNGIHVYDKKVLEEFRGVVNSEYGIDISDKSDHAIGAILSRIGILCGRGIYKLRRNDAYISKELATKIHDYINESSTPIFMTNTLFSIFEEELLAEGVDNKYFLQGILRDLYEKEWIFRRDYISKDASYTSVYSSIVGYIKANHYPVSKEDLFKEFPGLTEVVINISVSDPNILNLFGKYIHSSRLKLSNSDIEYLKHVVERHLKDKDTVNCHVLYDYINLNYPDLLSNNYVEYAFSLYSLLEYLFREDYIFSRPFVARENAEIERGIDVIKAIVRESETMEISEIQELAREQRVAIYSIRDFVDSCNETHVLLNNMTIASIDITGITEKIVKEIEEKILLEIDTTVPIHQLQCIVSLPTVKVEWTYWLLYSVLKKWASRLEVAASDSQFRYAYPVVAPVGKLDTTMFLERSETKNSKLVLADDLSNIDNLIEGYLSDELEGLDEL